MGFQVLAFASALAAHSRSPAVIFRGCPNNESAATLNTAVFNSQLASLGPGSTFLIPNATF